MKRSFTVLFSVFIIIVSAFTVKAQKTGKIVGTVVSEAGDKLENINVIVQGTQRGDATDKDGHFTIVEAPAGDHVLVASAIGYKTVYQSITVTGEDTIDIVFVLNKTTTELSAITVKGEALKDKKRTITVNSVTLEEIKTSNIIQTESLVEQVPGVNLMAYGQGGVANVFSIRGFNGGGHAGEVAVQVDGVLLNETASGHGGGYADFSTIIPLNVASLDVYKGPSSVLFGRFAQGGALAFETRKGGNYQDYKFSAGSYKTFDVQAALGQPFSVGDKKLTTNIAFQLFYSDGYMENSDYLKGNFSGRVAYNFTEKTDIAVSLKAHRSEWDAPGYVSENQYENKDLRDQQDEFAENDGGFKTFSSERIDLHHTINENLRLLVFGYAVQQEHTRYAKFNFSPGGQTESYSKRDVYAAGGSLNGRASIGSVGVDWLAGVEYYYEEADVNNWNTSHRERQKLTTDRAYRSNTLSGYLKGIFEISQYFIPSVGFRYDMFFGAFTNSDPGITETSGDLRTFQHVSPKIGIRSNLFKGFNLRASISNGFYLPDNLKKSSTTKKLDPIQIWQYEAGFDYKYKSLFKIDAAVFVLNTTNEVVESPPGSNQFINAGKTQRRGIEVGAEIHLLPRLEISGSFSYTETEILNNPKKALVGNELNGIPSTITNVAVNYRLKNGLGVKLSLRDVGSYATGMDNSNYYEGYTVTNGKIFYELGGEISSKGRIFLEINNIFNEYYAGWVHDSYGGPSGMQIYAPAPLRNFMIGINYNL